MDPYIVDPSEKPWGPYQGMTVNERLFVAGKKDDFDRAAQERNSEKMLAILRAVNLYPLMAQKVVDEVLRRQPPA
jgi:hypothetical protein